MLLGQQSGGGATGTERPWKESVFSATVGQITFLVPNIPADAFSIEFHVNGVIYERADDYVESGATFTWLNNLFVLKAGDSVMIRYK